MNGLPGPAIAIPTQLNVVERLAQFHGLHARASQDRRGAPRRSASEGGVSAAQAKNIARQQVPGGEVVDVSRNGSVYRVRIVAGSGRVVDVSVDARSGRVVG